MNPGRSVPPGKSSRSPSIASSAIGKTATIRPSRTTTPWFSKTPPRPSSTRSAVRTSMASCVGSGGVCGSDPHPASSQPTSAAAPMSRRREISSVVRAIPHLPRSVIGVFLVDLDIGFRILRQERGSGLLSVSVIAPLLQPFPVLRFPFPLDGEFEVPRRAVPVEVEDDHAFDHMFDRILAERAVRGADRRLAGDAVTLREFDCPLVGIEPSDSVITNHGASRVHR